MLQLRQVQFLEEEASLVFQTYLVDFLVRFVPGTRGGPVVRQTRRHAKRLVPEGQVTVRNAFDRALGSFQMAFHRNIQIRKDPGFIYLRPEFRLQALFVPGKGYPGICLFESIHSGVVVIPQPAGP